MDLTNHCSCGCAERHVVTKRLTSDGIGVMLWSTGMVSGRFETLPGVPARRPRTAEGQAKAMAAGHLFMGLVELYDLVELPDLYEACERVARRGGVPGDVGLELEAMARPERSLYLRFETTCGDARGQWVEQVAVLDRIRWPGLVVCRTRAGYQVFAETYATPNAGPCSREPAHMPTGPMFTNRRKLVDYLFSLLKN